MDPLIAARLSQRRMPDADLAFSALPGAPVVPGDTGMPRVRLAAMLRRAADRLAPEPTPVPQAGC